MRVIGGISRGTKIDTIESANTRPTLDRVRESLFNIIQNEVREKTVLDLFAGSGALGIEALSRGANKAIFCDNNNDAIKIIKSNLEKTKLYDKAQIYNCDFKKCISRINENIDLVFLDPPYKENFAIIAIENIENNNYFTNSLIIIETDEPERIEKEINIKSQMRIIDKRKYGRAYLLFLRGETYQF